MLHYSFSTILMAVIATNLLIILLTFCFRNTKVMINAGYKLLALFILFVILRFLLPFEFPFTKSVYWSDLLSLTIWQVHYWLFEIAGYPISLWTIFEFIWFIGIFINLTRYIVTYLKAQQYITLNAKVITKKEPFCDLMNQICQELNKPNKFTLIELPGIEAPVLYGIIKPCILIPEKMELSDQDWYYILQHEASHHFHHDILMKNIVKLITIFYWWNPFCIILNRQTDVILEMRVDDSLTLKDASVTGSYLQCLIDVSEHMAKTKLIPQSLTMSLLPTELSDMSKRFRMLIANQKKRNLSLNILLFSIAATIYVLSYVFILEAFHPIEEIEPSFDQFVIPVQNDTYAIQKSDGTYEIYLNGIYLDTVDSLEYYLDITVYTEDDFPE